MSAVKTYLLIFLLFGQWSYQVCAQPFRAQMILKGQPTSLLSDWINHPDILSYIVTFSGGPIAGNYSAKIIASFKDGAGNIIGTTDWNLLPNHIFTPGTVILQSRDAVLLQCIRFTGSYQRTLNNTGRLPQGSYQLGLQLVDAQTLQKLTDEVVRPFTLMGYQLPILLQPQPKAILASEQARNLIIFRWTPLSPTPAPTAVQTQTKYALQVFEIQEGQTPMQAFRSNQPILNKEILGATQYIWHPQLYLADSSQNRKFIWTIQTLDEQGLGFNNGVGDGRSEPTWFEIKSGKEILEERIRKKN